MKVFIICYNRLTPLKAMCEYLTNTGAEVWIVDNNSTYEPLIDWLKICPYKVIYMLENYGHQVLWNEAYKFITDRYYCVTDHDLDLSQIPHDWIEVLKQGLIENKDVIKSGFSLQIDDLPENNYTKEVIAWETKFWQTERRGKFFLSDIDTTLAMYDRDRDFGKLPNDRFFSAVRADKPYTALHLPWYLTKESIENNPEEKYYFENTHTYWAGKMKELL